MKKILAAMLMAAAAPGWAMNAGVDASFGDNGYKQYDIYAGFAKDSLSISPEFSIYDSDTFADAFKTASVRVGYDTRFMGVGLTGGTTFKNSTVSDYSNLFFGADAAVTLSPTGESGVRRIGGSSRGGAPVGKGLARIDIGAGAKITQHKDSPIVERKTNQTEIHGFAGASILGALISARLTKSTYDDDVAANVPVAGRTNVPGHVFVVNAYPDVSFTASGELTMLPMIRPSISYTKTSYQAFGGTAIPDTSTVGLGVKVGLEMLYVNGAYQHMSVDGGSSQDFVQLGAGLRF